MHRIDGPGATADNHFTEGNPAGAVPATVVTDDFMNAVQDEIVNVILDPAVTPAIALNKTVNTQLATAIKRLITSLAPVAADASETVKGVIRLASQSESIAGTNALAAITPATLKALFSATGQQSIAATGYQVLPGGWILQWGLGTVTINNTGGTAVVSLPKAFPNAHFGGLSCVQQVGIGNDALCPYYDPTSLSTATLTIDVSTGNPPVGAKSMFYICIGR